MNHSKYTYVAIAGLLSISAAQAYEPITHQDLSERAAAKSVLSNSAILRRLGFTGDIASIGFLNSEGQNQSIVQLIRFGADWEDTRGALQALRHFYNPVNGSKLLPVAGETSPDWAIEDRGVKAGQPYSYRLMRRNFQKALTDPAKSDRDAAWGLTFQTMGHVIHHLQDMAQPQHVRADAHCDAPYPCLVPGSAFGLFGPSVYEKQIQQRLPESGNYPAVYSKDDTTTFDEPRKFWHSNAPSGQATGVGIAEFTNHNFISAGTNFDKPNLFPSPRIDGTLREEIQIADLCAELGPPCNTLGLKGIVKFFGNQVVDNYTRQTTFNPRMTTLSVFDKFLDKQGKTQVFSYNRANAIAAAKLLVPRAVGYSAGMINYFFRGDIDMERAADGQGGYLIRNKGTEPMAGRFALYYDDATDNRYQIRDAGGQPIEWTTAVYAGAALAPGVSMRVPEFPVPSSPTSKIAGEFMLVFNGDMGEETRATFGVGAVVAQKIEVQRSGALYILASQGFQDVTLRVDKTGTNIVKPGEFNPYEGINADDDNSGIGDTYFKFPRFKAGIGGGLGYEVTAFGIDAFPKARLQVKAPSGTFVSSQRRQAWHVQSGNDEFEFSLNLEAAAAQPLFYTRRYRDSTGTMREESGTATWPGAPMSPELARAQMISADGLRFGEFRQVLTATTNTTGADTVIRVTETSRPILKTNLVITLGTPPSVSVETANGVYSTRKETWTHPSHDTTTYGGPITFCDGGAGTNSVREKYSKNLTEWTLTQTSRIAIGSFNGNATWAETIQNDSGQVGLETLIKLENIGCYGGVNSSRSTGYGEGWDSLTLSFRNTFPSGAREDTWFHYGIGQPNDSGYDQHAVLPLYDVINSAPPPWQSKGMSDSGGTLEVVRGLNDQAADAVYSRSGKIMFRTYDVGNRYWVADGSPLGEVFFATKDMGIIVHEPKGTMPVFVPPPGITKLKRAIWL